MLHAPGESCTTERNVLHGRLLQRRAEMPARPSSSSLFRGRIAAFASLFATAGPAAQDGPGGGGAAELVRVVRWFADRARRSRHAVERRGGFCSSYIGLWKNYRSLCTSCTRAGGPAACGGKGPAVTAPGASSPARSQLRRAGRGSATARCDRSPRQIQGQDAHSAPRHDAVVPSPARGGGPGRVRAASGPPRPQGAPRARRARRPLWGGRWARKRRDMERIGLYARLARRDGPGTVDDRTWRDLDLDEVFAHVDRTSTAVGQQLLCARLRAPPRDPAEREAFEVLVHRFSADPALRERAHLALLPLADLSASTLPLLFVRRGARPSRGGGSRLAHDGDRRQPAPA